MPTCYQPEQIRALRGRLSRVAFAKRLKVTALTVYRWELPATAAESRRPRGSVLARLNDYQLDSASAAAITEAQEIRGAVIGAEALVDAIQRLTVRGLMPAAIVPELGDALATLFPGAGLQLDDIDAVSAALPNTQQVLELNDCSGRRLRIRASSLSPDAFEMLKSVVQVAVLALEVARLQQSLTQTT